MIAIDTNILVYAHRNDLPEHPACAATVDGALAGVEPVAICWPVVHEFVAVVTNPRVFTTPTPVALAWDQIEHWLASPRATVLGESRAHLATMRLLVEESGVVGGAIHDARIAAMCIDSGVRELLTADRDFTRFPGLRVRNPLAA